MIRRFEGQQVLGTVLLAFATAWTGGCGSPPPPQPPTPPTPTVVAPVLPPTAVLSGVRQQIHTNLDPNLCLNDAASGTADGNPVFLWHCEGGKNDVWSFSPGPSDANTIKGIGDKCIGLDPTGATALFACSDVPTQIFKHYADNTFRDGSAANCLTAASAANRAVVSMTPCAANNPAQAWTVADAPPPPPPPPVATVQRIELEDGRFKLHEEILFKSGSADIDEKSHEFLDYIGFMLKEHHRVDFIEIAGHADKRGGEQLNVPLTQKRAESVLAYLLGRDLSPHRFRAVGYGAYCPLDPADNEAAYAKNRRVEFRILRNNGADTRWKWDGCDEAGKHGMKPLPIPKDAQKSKPRRSGKLVIVRKGFELIFPDEVHFEAGSAALHPDSEPVLLSLKAFLDKDKAVEKIRIEGHTDSFQNTPDMVALSKARSKAVAEWLANHGVNPGRLLPVGCGSNRPIKTKEGKVDHTRTKRTEAHVIAEKGKPIGAPVPADCSAD